MSLPEIRNPADLLLITCNIKHVKEFQAMNFTVKSAHLWQVWEKLIKDYLAAYNTTNIWVVKTNLNGLYLHSSKPCRDQKNIVVASNSNCEPVFFCLLFLSLNIYRPI